jgi:hypothetical protein
MQFRNLSFLFLTLTVGAVAAGGACQSPDQFLRDGGTSQGHGGSGGGVFAGNAGSNGTGAGGHAGSGGSTFAGTAGTTGGSGGTGGSSAGSTGSDAGAGGTGPMPCSSCQVTIQYTCRSSDKQTISFIVRPINMASTPIPMSNLTIRYWFTANTWTTPVVDCDYAALKGLPLSCDNIVHKPPATDSPTTFHTVTPALPTADHYLEIGFDSAAGTLEGFHSPVNANEDQLQFRVHDISYANMTQTDDYSFNCPDGGGEFESPLITAYVGGVLKFGTEPQ